MDEKRKWTLVYQHPTLENNKNVPPDPKYHRVGYYINRNTKNRKDNVECWRKQELHVLLSQRLHGR